MDLLLVREGLLALLRVLGYFALLVWFLLLALRRVLGMVA